MKHIISWSGGKDSTATVILAHIHNIPIDEIIFCEVMFDENISGELPEHIDFIRNKAIPLFESWGYKVTVVRGEKTYMDCFNHIIEKPRKHAENKGKRKGFMMVGKCDTLRECKLKPMTKYTKKLGDFKEYIGIAIDEPKRLARMKDNQISLLEKYNMTELQAKELCEEYDLLSPLYSFANRGGCWFCPNARMGELRNLRSNHRELFEKLKELEREPNLIAKVWNNLTKTSIFDVEREIELIENQITVDDLLKEHIRKEGTSERA